MSKMDTWPVPDIYAESSAPYAWDQKGRLWFRGLDEFMSDMRQLPEEVFGGTTWIISYPKSGTNWVANIAKKIIAGDASPSSEVFIPIEVLCGVESKEKALSTIKEATPTRLIVSHLYPEHFTEDQLRAAKVIVVMRNPKDTAVSYYNFHKVTPALGLLKKDFHYFFPFYLDGNVYNGSYFDHVLSWWKLRHLDNILVVKYEDVKKNHHALIREIAAFVGKSLDDTTVAAIADATNFENVKAMAEQNKEKRLIDGNKHEPKVLDFLRKGQVGDWRNHFTAEESEAVDKMIEKSLSDSGLSFTYDP